jgi:hypothetical protein
MKYWRAESRWLGECFTALPRVPAAQSLRERELVREVRRVCLAPSPLECIRAITWGRCPPTLFMYSVEDPEAVEAIRAKAWAAERVLGDEWRRTHEAWSRRPVTLTFRWVVEVRWDFNRGKYVEPILTRIKRNGCAAFPRVAVDRGE